MLLDYGTLILAKVVNWENTQLQIYKTQNRNKKKKISHCHIGM